MARSSFSHWLVGLSSSVLKDEFVSSYRHGDSLDGVEPFSGKLMLPTKLQTLKLHFFLKDAKGRKDSNVTPGEITSKVSEVIKHYWNLAGFETVSSSKNRITKLCDNYKDQLKKKNMTNPKTQRDRKTFEEDLNKLFDIAHPQLEKKLAEDRIRGNLDGKKSEDLSFLQDQRGERKMSMGKVDEEYSKKKAAQLKRKLGSAPSSSVTSQDILSEDPTESCSDSSPIKDSSRDEEFNVKEKMARRSDFITVDLPRDPLASLGVTGTLDRINMSDRTAMHFVSSILQTARKDGKQMDLNKLVRYLSVLLWHIKWLPSTERI